MLHTIKVKSEFDKDILKSFKVVSIEPKFDIDEDREDFFNQTVCINRTYSLYIDKEYYEDCCILWINPRYQINERYAINCQLTKEEYLKSLKKWNVSYDDIKVVDINNKR